IVSLRKIDPNKIEMADILAALPEEHYPKTRAALEVYSQSVQGKRNPAEAPEKGYSRESVLRYALEAAGIPPILQYMPRLIRNREMISDKSFVIPSNVSDALETLAALAGQTTEKLDTNPRFLATYFLLRSYYGEDEAFKRLQVEIRGNELLAGKVAEADLT